MMSFIIFGARFFSPRISQSVDVRGINSLILSNFLLFLAFMINGLRGSVSELITSGLGSFLWFVSVYLLLEASIHIRDNLDQSALQKKKNLILFRTLALFVSAFQFSLVVFEVPFAYRTILFSSTIGFLFLASGLILLRGVLQEPKSLHFSMFIISFGLFGNATSMFLRAGHILGSNDFTINSASLLQPTPLQIFLAIFAFISIQMVTIGYLFLFWQKAESALTKAASTDPLTQALNRRAIEAYLKSKESTLFSSTKSIACILMDLDHFKKVNDVYGHATGDLVLKSFSNIVHKHLSPLDALGRYGGEEFLLILVNQDFEQSKQTLHDILLDFSKTVIQTPQGDRQFTSSAGLAFLGPQSKFISWEDLIHQADGALYKAKEAGRNQFKVAPQATM